MRISLVLLFFTNSALVFGQAAEFSFLEHTLYLSEVVEGDSVEFQYEFTNTGDAPILIESIELCHCTKATWPEGEIAPGEGGLIKATFYSEEMVGEQKKALLIWYNDRPEPFKLRFAIDVKKKRRRHD